MLFLSLLLSAADPALSCDACEEWNKPHEPFRVFGNTYYVGVHLSAVLVTSPKGHVLLDGGLPQSAALIEKNVRALGFRVEDIKLIVSSHAHFDHAGGIAALQRASGARVAASTWGAKALRSGQPVPDDPQFGELLAFPAVAKVEEVADGQTLRAGDVEITMVHTPGHTPGGASWTWKSCEGTRCLDVVYADSLSPVSAEGFRYSGPRATAFEKSIKKVAALPCDVLIVPHPELIGLFEKSTFIDRNACRAYADGAAQRLKDRLAQEQKAAAP